MSSPEQSRIVTEATTYCEVHPDRETALRCNRCGRLMCAECAVQTPVGYRCRECVRGQEDKFFKATQNDLLLVFAVCAALTGVVGALGIAIRIPLLFLLILGLPAGGAIAELALRATGRRRGRYSPQVAALGAVIGGLAGAFAAVYVQLQNLIQARGLENVTIPLDLVFQGVFNDWGTLLLVGLIAFAIYGRFRMRM